MTSREEQLEAALRTAKAKLEEQDAFIRQVSEAACPVGFVQQVSGEDALIDAGGTLSLIKAQPWMAPGIAVKIEAQSGQPLEAAKLWGKGTIAKVNRLVPGSSLCTVEGAAGLEQICGIMPGLKLAPGDEVELSPNGQLVLSVVFARPMEAGDFRPVAWDEVGGQAEAKRALADAVILPYTHRELAAAYGDSAPAGVLLWGPPGCGKTLLARAVATAIKGRTATVKDGFISVKGPELLNKWVGESERGVRGLFERAKEHHRQTGSPSVIFIDEAEAVLGRRGSGLGALSGTLVPAFLAEMNGLEKSPAIVILATNMPQSLDPAVLRDERIDRRVHVGRPNAEDGAAVLAVHARRLPYVEGYSAEQAVADVVRGVYEEPLQVLPGVTLASVVSGALLAGICRGAASLAFRRDAEAGAKRAAGATQGDFYEAISRSAAEQAFAALEHKREQSQAQQEN